MKRDPFGRFFGRLRDCLLGCLRNCLSLLSCLMLAACASLDPAPPQALFADARFAPASEPIGATDLFTLSPAMRAYLDSPAFQQRLRSKGSRHGLVDALYSQSDLRLEYDSTNTRNAAQTYEARVGNCLSLVLMTAAFAKALDMPVHYQSVSMDHLWSRSNGLYLSSTHINIGLGPNLGDVLRGSDPNQMLIVDFLPRDAAARLRSRTLDEEDVVALYLNNRAAEAMLQDRLVDAYWWARAAVQTRPRLVAALNTLGVVYHRHGDLAPAESAFKAALAQEPENLAVLRNMAPLLSALGRSQEAQALARKIAGIEPVPPYHYFDQGLAALKAGRYERAVALFEREVKRAPYNDEFRFWLGMAQLRLGNVDDARESMALALDHSTQREMRDLYAAKLAQLRHQAPGQRHQR